MVDLKAAVHTTLLLVDDDVQQLEVRALVMKMSGFTVLSASNPLDAISILAQRPGHVVDVAILDYDLPAINGCVLADYVRARYPEMKIILHSGAADIPVSEMGSVDSLVAKAEGVSRLLEEVSALTRFRHQQFDSIMREAPAATAAAV